MFKKYQKFLFIFLLFFVGVNCAMADIIPDGGKKTSGDYSLGDFVVLAINVSNFILGIVGSLTLLVFIVGGFMLLFSGGRSEMVARGRQAINGGVIGLVIVLTSWTVINFFMTNMGYEGEWNTTTVTDLTNDGSSTSVYPTEEQKLRDFLEDTYSITVNKDACSPGETSCTDIEGLRENTIATVINLANAIGGENITITGGTEDGHSNGTYSHANGYKVDLRLDDDLTNYVTTNSSNSYIRSSDNATCYGVGDIEYCLESDHWDVCVECG